MLYFNARACGRSILAKQQTSGLRVDYLPILLDIGMLDPIFQWALSMNSEEHRACAGVLMAAAEAAPLLECACVVRCIRLA